MTAKSTLGSSESEVSGTASPTSPRADRLWLMPRTWHFVSLALSAIVLAVAARNLWFFSDEWDFLIPSNDANIFSPHVGHWSTTPILVTQALRDVFGIDSYWPYIAVSMAVHLVLCHVLWRVMLRVGVNAWIATALAAMMMLLGAGAEDILWAFQLGFMGAVLIALVVVLLVDVATVTRVRWVVVELLAIWSLTFAGTALSVLFAAALVSWHRRGIWKTILQFGPVLVIYGIWYVFFALGHTVSFGPKSFRELAVGVPEFFAREFTDGLGSLVPFRWLGIVVVICLVAWVILSFRLWRGRSTPAFALAAAAIVQATLIALTRVHIGLYTAASPRYVYILVALLLPVIGLTLTRLAHTRSLLTAIIVGLVLVVAAYNTYALAARAVHRTEFEQSSKARISAALSLVFREHVPVGASLIPSPGFADDLDMANLEAMYKRGWIHISAFDEDARLSVLARLRVTAGVGSAPETQTQCQSVAAGNRASFPASSHGVRVHVSKTTKGGLYLTHGKSIGDVRSLTLHSAWSRIVSSAGTPMTLRLNGPATICVS